MKMEKGILKLTAKGKTRMMHYVVMDDHMKALAMGDTDLIRDLNEDHHIEIILNIKEDKEIPANVQVIEDKEQVKTLFDTMLELNHTWFKEYDDHLVVLDITTK
jgi:hypothetical protein